MPQGYSLTLDTHVLDTMLKEMDKNGEKVVRETAFRAEGFMKEFAAVDTGAMKSSIYTETYNHHGFSQASSEAHAEAAKNKRTVNTVAHPTPKDTLTAHVGPCVDYAEYVEMGTGRAAAQPFVIPGVGMAYTELIERAAGIFE